MAWVIASSMAENDKFGRAKAELSAFSGLSLCALGQIQRRAYLGPYITNSDLWRAERVCEQAKEDSKQLAAVQRLIAEKAGAKQ